MSQFYIGPVAGALPPVVPTSFVTQLGTAVPAANILIVNADDSTENNTNGIITKGGVIGTGTANEVDVIITNRLTGTVTTVALGPVPMITFPLSVIGTYAIEARVAAYNTTSLEGAAYSMFAGVRFDGVNANLCGTPDRIVNEEGTMSAPPPGANCTITVSGGNVLINAVGYAGQSIKWSSVALYTFVGA
jgi:hypothetical protein